MDSDSSSWLALAGIIICAGLLIFFSAAESGLRGVRRYRLRQKGEGVESRARLVEALLQQERLVLEAFLLGRALALILATVIITILATKYLETPAALVVLALSLFLLALAALGPRAWARHRPEETALALARPASLAAAILLPPLGLLERLIVGLLVPIGATSTIEAESEEQREIFDLAEIAEEEGGIEAEEREMIRAIFEMERTPVREIMVPRVDIAAVSTEASLSDVLDLAVARGYSRIPLYQETMDQIVGVIYVKDLIPHLRQGKTTVSLKEIARPAYFIPDTMMVDDLLRELQRRRVHMAIVADEYGGTAGVATIEDLLEEIVGEIEDEYDAAEMPVERLSEVEAVVDGRVSIDALNQMFDLQIEGEGFDTVGGFLYQRLGKIPSVGDVVNADGLTLRVLSTLGRRIKKVRATKVEVPDAGQATQEMPSAQ